MFGEMRLGKLSLAHAPCYPINSVVKHVVLRYRLCTAAVLEGCTSAARSPRINLRDYGPGVDVVGEVLSARKGTACIFNMHSACLLVPSNHQERSRVFMVFVRLLGYAARKGG